MNLLVTQALLLVPLEEQSSLCVTLLALLRQQRTSHGATPAGGAERLLDLLTTLGWQAEYDADDLLAVTVSPGHLHSLEEDGALSAVLHHSLPGSMVQGYRLPAYLPWQLRKTTQGVKHVRGYLSFPSDTHFTPASKALLRVRQVQTPEEVAALSTRGGQPVRLEEGAVLLAQRGKQALAFLQYRVFDLDASTAIVTCLVQRNEGDDETVVRLLRTLQARFSRLLLAPALLPLHEVVQPLGFSQVEEFHVWGWTLPDEGRPARSCPPRHQQTEQAETLPSGHGERPRP